MSVDYLPLPGTPIDELETPALIVDLDVAEGNIRALQHFCDEQGTGVRPHAKTHKSPYWALKQIEAGAVGVCVAKVGEAEALADGGVRDIMIANEVTSPIKIARLMALAAQADLIVAVDSAENVDELSRAALRHGVELGVVVDVNVRLDRCGVAPGEPATVLSRLVERAPALRFEGLMGYEGHISGSDDERRAETMTAMEKLFYAADDILAAGLPLNIMSAGGTSTFDITGSLNRVTDIQCGSYIFMDAAYAEEVAAFDPALTLLSTVIDRPSPELAVLDVGLDCVSTNKGLPRLPELSGAVVSDLAEAECAVHLSGAARALSTGDRVSVLPMYGDTTINLHSHYFCVRDGALETVIDVAGRGRFR